VCDPQFTVIGVAADPLTLTCRPTDAAGNPSTVIKRTCQFCDPGTVSMITPVEHARAGGLACAGQSPDVTRRRAFEFF
jgi:hypothetical protein